MSILFTGLTSITTFRDGRWEEIDEDEDDETALERAYYSRWKQVEAFIPMVVAVRQEQHHRARTPGDQ